MVVLACLSFLDSDTCPNVGRLFPQLDAAGQCLDPNHPQCIQTKGLTSDSRWKLACPYYFETAPEMATMPRILIADDQPDVLNALRLLLKGQGYETEAVTSPVELLRCLAEREFDLLLMDLNYARDTTSGREGLDLLSQLKEIEDAPAIVVMTGWATVGLAVEAMQYGVADFVEKPWTNTRLLEILEKQIGLGRERRASRRRVAQENRDHK